jgi:hypothetical protein
MQVGAPWPEKYAGPSPVPHYDTFHELILIDEICRCGSGGVVWGLVEGLQIGLPPILHFGTPHNGPPPSYFSLYSRNSEVSHHPPRRLLTRAGSEYLKTKVAPACLKVNIHWAQGHRHRATSLFA